MSEDFAELAFSYQIKSSIFEEDLSELLWPEWDDWGVDYYDSSIELYKAPVGYRLSNEAHRFLQDSGFGIVYLNRVDGSETHYFMGRGHEYVDEKPPKL